MLLQTNAYKIMLDIEHIKVNTIFLIVNFCHADVIEVIEV